MQIRKGRQNIVSKDNKSVLKEVATGVAVSLVITSITSAINIIKSLKISQIDIGEWDNSYNRINKMLYDLNPGKYTKHKIPTANKEHFELSVGVSYFVKLNKGNYLKIESYKDKNDKGYYRELRLKIIFFGKEKYKNREKFLMETLRLTDKEHIRVQHLNEFEMSCDIIPHSFNNIVMEDKTRQRLIRGLCSWNESKKWYKEHQLVHKIGVFLYGEPGTGKSTIARAISSMFNNAPILTIDHDNIMRSINGIFKMRKKYEGAIIILIEDFDLYFKSREELSGIELDINQKAQKDKNQNAIFQLLDGIYSTENTIYIATTNFRDRIDPALIRYGRFDIQEEMKYFNRNQALAHVKILGYDENVLNELKLEYPVQPSYLQSKIMEYRGEKLNITIK